MTDDRAAVITLGGEPYEIILTMRAAREMAKRYGGLEHIGERIQTDGLSDDTIREIVWMVTLLANQGIAIHNLRNPHDPKPLLTEDTVELLAGLQDLQGFGQAIMACLTKGTARTVESQTEAAGPNAPAG